MTIIYLSLPFFADCDFPLVKELRKQGCRVIHIIPITPQCLKSTLIDISKQYPLNGIFKTDIYDEIKIYSEYLDEKDTYIVNRNYTSKHLLKRLKSTFQLLKLIRSFRPDYVWTSSPFGFYDLILYTLPNIVLTVQKTIRAEALQRKSLSSYVKNLFCLMTNSRKRLSMLII